METRVWVSHTHTHTHSQPLSADRLLVDLPGLGMNQTTFVSNWVDLGLTASEVFHQTLVLPGNKTHPHTHFLSDSHTHSHQPRAPTDGVGPLGAARPEEPRL